jgi:glycosyltransferase involved in cell wall biosynthesis
MYCGSCFRDNALAAELLRRGHDVTLMPVYTPTRTDERNVSQPGVLFGGISVYLQQRSPLFRRLPRVLDRLWDAPAVIRALTSGATSTDPGTLGALTLSMLEGTGGALRREFEKLVEWTAGEPAPDVVILPNSLLIALAEPLRQAFKRPVCCTLQGEELFIDGLQPSFREQVLARIRAQAVHVDRFIAVSDYCARFMTEWLRLPPEKVVVVPLGINMDGYEAATPRPHPFTVGYFARVAPEKGLHILADAYIRFRRREPSARARLHAAGYLSAAHRAYLREIKERLERAGLGGEFEYRGEVDRAGKLRFLRELDVLSVPATYDEPKGLFLLEAMASGVPVVVPRRGALTEVVERTGGGTLVTPDDPQSLADALGRLFHDRDQRAHLGERAFSGVRAHYTVGASADRLLEALTPLTAGEHGAPTPEAVGGRPLTAA